jgi:3-oxoacyl-[acyl-carrier-protein] synthase-3
MKLGLKLKGIGMFVPHASWPTKTGSEDWVKENLGIENRHLCSNESENVVQLGATAAAEAIIDAGISVEDIGYIIVVTSSPDYLSPSTACMIQDKLGYGLSSPCLDINAVCSGFVYALDLANSLVERYTNVLIVATETYSKITEWVTKEDVFFGDGAAAVVVSKSRTNNFYSRLGANGDKKDVFSCKKTETFEMNTKGVYDFATKVLPREIKKTLNSRMMSLSEIDYIVPHQASLKALTKTAEILEFPLDKVILNMKDYGNTAGASIPMALYCAIKDGRIKDSSKLMLAAVGSGMTYGTAYWKLDYDRR